MKRSQLIIATRGSELALAQTKAVSDALLNKFPKLEIKTLIVKTFGDRHPRASLKKIGGQGVFVIEVRRAVLEKKADICVHSLKDLPTYNDDNLTMPAVLKRGDVRDALVGLSLYSMKKGATIATGSKRREAQLKLIREDLNFADLRGNINTRIQKIPPEGAIVVALIALERLGLSHLVSYVFDPDDMVPQVGQGAIAIECRSDDGELIELLKEINHEKTFFEVSLERAFLRHTNYGCSEAVGGYSELQGSSVNFKYFLGSSENLYLRGNVLFDKTNAFKKVSDLVSVSLNALQNRGI